MIFDKIFFKVLKIKWVLMKVVGAVGAVGVVGAVGGVGGVGTKTVRKIYKALIFNYVFL